MTGLRGIIVFIVLKKISVFPVRRDGLAIIVRRKDLRQDILRFCEEAHGMKSLGNTQQEVCTAIG